MTLAQLTPEAAADPAVPPADPAAPPAAGDLPAHPEWLAEKFHKAANPVEEQAKAYAEAQKLIGKQRDEITASLRTELEPTLREEITAALKAEMGAPAEATAYVMPEGLEAPEPLADAFRSRAYELGMTQAQFDGMASLYAETQAIDIEAERAALGPKADDRIAAVTQWGNKNIPADLQGEAMKLMRTAAGFQLVETLMKRAMPRDVLPNPEDVVPPKTLADMQQQLRDMQKDPRYSTNPKTRDNAFIAEVQAFAAKVGEARAKAGG